MRVLVVTPPDPVVTLDEAKAHLRAEDDNEDVLIAFMVEAATGHIAGPDGWLGRALGLQTLKAYLDAPGPDGLLRPPCPPVVSVTAISSRAADGSWVLVDDVIYETQSDRVALAWGKRWPAVPAGGETFRIVYEAGYAEVPAPIRAAILLMVGDLYRNRSSVAIGTTASVIEVPMSTTVASLLAPFRVWSA